MIAERLRKAVLQAAIQGKLTQQLPQDGDARDLLAEITAEKEQLIREGKIKRQKPLPEITEDEIPFEIPENWCWVRLGTVTHNHGQKVPDDVFTYIDISSIDNQANKLGSISKVLSPAQAPSRARKVVKYGDVIYSTVRPYLHNICIVDKEIIPEPIVSTGFAVVTTGVELANRYLFRVFVSPMFDSYANDAENSKGVAYPAINDQRFQRAPIPLPPLSEQQRIVAKLEEILPQIDKLQAVEEELAKLQDEFPQKLKNSLLQAAIQGKLTEQLPEDGDARELLAEIETEKQRLIKEGKIKKQKLLPAITQDEIPFEIPENWCWVRLGEVSEVSAGTTPKAHYVSTRGVVPFYKVADMNLSGNEIEMNESSCFLAGSYKGRLTPFPSVIYPKNGGAVFTNKRRIVSRECLVDLNTGYCSPVILSVSYLYFWLMSVDFALISAGTALPTVSASTIKDLLLPLPPLSEQQRIVAKLEELLPLCDALDVQ